MGLRIHYDGLVTKMARHLVDGEKNQSPHSALYLINVGNHGIRQADLSERSTPKLLPSPQCQSHQVYYIWQSSAPSPLNITTM